MRAIMSVILTIVLSVASATAGIRHYCDTTATTTTLVTENKRDYYGADLVYRNDTLEMVLTDNGYVDAQGCYHYYVRDYQGNIRQVADAQGNVIEQNVYYPYGGLFGESASHQSYKYSGKELETMNGLNTYDFHARPYYYPAIIFHSPDILSEKAPWLSPYLYCAGNPVMFIDPTGMEFTETAQKYANNLISAAFNRIINTYISSETDWNVITQAVNTIKETIELKYSSQLYDVVEDKSLGYGFGETRTNSSKGTVEIALGNMDVSIDLIAHEFKHLSQFENGEISLTDKNAKGRGYLLYDKTDEMDAYYRGFIFGGPEIKDIKDLPENYQDLPNEQMNINIFLKRNHPFSTSNKAIDDILRSRSKVQKQSFRYKGKTYLYKVK